MKTLKLFVLAAALAASPACKKKQEDAPKPPVTEPGSASGATPTPGSAAAAPVPQEDKTDYIQVLGEHAEKKPTDPVVVKFEKFAVKKAAFDPQNVEGGTATIEVDLASLKSGSDKRDTHLTTADYIDTSKFTTMTIDVANVKKQDGNKYTADAKVKLRDVEKTYPVTFEVVEAKDDWIRVKGEHKFARLDFKVGKEKTGPDESVAQDLTVKLQLTLKKT